MSIYHFIEKINKDGRKIAFSIWKGKMMVLMLLILVASQVGLWVVVIEWVV
jgi:hypothetical protein